MNQRAAEGFKPVNIMPPPTTYAHKQQHQQQSSNCSTCACSCSMPMTASSSSHHHHQHQPAAPMSAAKQQPRPSSSSSSSYRRHEDSYKSNDTKKMSSGLVKSAGQLYEQQIAQERAYAAYLNNNRQPILAQPPPQTQQKQQPQPVVHSRLEKAKQLARRINDTENYNFSQNMDRMSTHSSSSISPVSSYSSSPTYMTSSSSSSSSSPSSSSPVPAAFAQLNNSIGSSSSNSNSSSALNSPSAASDSSSHFNFPPIPNMNAAQNDLLASLLPLYISQYLATLQSLNPGQQQPPSDYLQTLTSAIHALTNQSTANQSEKQPAFKSSSAAAQPQSIRRPISNPVSAFAAPLSNKKQHVSSSSSSPPRTKYIKYPTILIENKEQAARQVDEHFERSLGLNYQKIAAKKTAVTKAKLGSRDSADIASPTKRVKSSAAPATDKSQSHTDLVIDESSSSSDEVLLIDSNHDDSSSQMTTSYHSEDDEIDNDDDNGSENSVSSVDSAGRGGLAGHSRASQKRAQAAHFVVDSHFSKALGQSVWSSLKEKQHQMLHSVSNSTSPCSSTDSSLNHSFSNGEDC
jgi:hypothetical protein